MKLERYLGIVKRTTIFHNIFDYPLHISVNKVSISNLSYWEDGELDDSQHTWWTTVYDLKEHTYLPYKKYSYFVNYSYDVHTENTTYTQAADCEWFQPPRTCKLH